MEIEKIAAMAVAAIAEEEGTYPEALRIVSFREIKKTELEQYLADNNIEYKKYQLGDL